jgi:hypothetical protein
VLKLRNSINFLDDVKMGGGYICAKYYDNMDGIGNFGSLSRENFAMI